MGDKFGAARPLLRRLLAFNYVTVFFDIIDCRLHWKFQK